MMPDLFDEGANLATSELRKEGTILATSELRKAGFARGLTRVLESVGLLNKGSSKAPATPSARDAAATAGVSTNALNVTRVAGLATTVTVVGAAALALFHVTKTTDPIVVVAAYWSVGIIIAAALLTAAIIISADIKSRVAVSTAPAPPAQPAAAAGSFTATWNDALQVLKGALGRLERRTEDPINAWLDASGSSGLTARLTPPEGQAAVHATLLACQSRIVLTFQALIGEADPGRRGRASDEIQVILDSMDRLLLPA
jgi:hypothetical protein